MLRDEAASRRCRVARGKGLKAIAPSVATTDYYTAPWYSDGGALSLQVVHFWTTAMAFLDAQREVAAGVGDVQELMGLAAVVADPAPHGPPADVGATDA